MSDTATETTIIPLTESLRQLPTFSDLSESDLAYVASLCREEYMEPGEVVFAIGDETVDMLILFSGEFEARGDRTETEGVYIARGGTITGRLPYSRMRNYVGTALVTQRLHLAKLDKKHFPELLYRVPILGERFVAIMSDRVRERTRAEQERDRMASLGRLSAGLAHELNNPAAAAKRAADNLLRALDCLANANALLFGCLSGEQYAAIIAWELAAAAKLEHVLPLSPMQQSEFEDEIITWLEDHDVADAYDLAPRLLEVRVTANDLDGLAAGIGAEGIAALAAQIAAALEATKLTQEIASSVGRISELVRSIKEYSFMDQGGMQPIDLNRGLESTITMLAHKTKGKSIQVRREYSADLPKIPAFGGQLNQVWTNLIDNAADALAVGGAITVRTLQDTSERVRIEIEDNGSGIPESVQKHIFEPFFTTKPVGEGTGLGLDAVRRIVQVHHGEIRLQSVPGKTTFTVLLPV
jgi:signal transduction histidine kinase